MLRIHINDDLFLPHAGCLIDFKIDRGEVILFTGPNGLGKTTLMRRIYMEQQSDCVHVEQIPLTSFYDRRLGKIKELFLASKKKSLNKDRFIHLWKAFGLNDKDQRFQSTLSGGEEQALKLCLGLALETPLYILDEPSQHLDSYSKSILNDWIQEEQRNLKSIILVEHDFDWLKCLRTDYQLKFENMKLVLGH
jgi:energy-coupling factor transport system ATP-binding protein